MTSESHGRPESVDASAAPTSDSSSCDLVMVGASRNSVGIAAAGPGTAPADLASSVQGPSEGRWHGHLIVDLAAGVHPSVFDVVEVVMGDRIHFVHSIVSRLYVAVTLEGPDLGVLSRLERDLMGQLPNGVLVDSFAEQTPDSFAPAVRRPGIGLV